MQHFILHGLHYLQMYLFTGNHNEEGFMWQWQCVIVAFPGQTHIDQDKEIL